MSLKKKCVLFGPSCVKGFSFAVARPAKLAAVLRASPARHKQPSAIRALYEHCKADERVEALTHLSHKFITAPGSFVT